MNLLANVCMLARIDESEIALIATVLGIGCVIAVVAIISYHVRRIREAAYQAHLKDQMIQRGMSAEEIERVIAARPLDAGEKFVRDAARGITGCWTKRGM